MEFVELSEKEFTSFAENHQYESFHQTTGWGKLKETNGWKYYFVGVKDNKKVMAAALLLSKMTPIKKNMFYSPRGFLIDYNNKELLKFFTEEVKKFVKSKKGIFLKLDPYVEYQQRDINGEIVKDGYDNKQAYQNLIDLGYKHFGFNLYQETLQPRWIYTVTTKDKTEKELMSGMDYETRRIIRKNEKGCIITRELSYDELHLFKDIMEKTSERRDFIDRPLSYYQDMYKYLHKDNKLKIVVVELHTDMWVKSLEKELKENEDDYNSREYKHDNHVIAMNEDKYIQKQKEVSANIKRLKENLEEAKRLKEEKSDVILLGGAMFLLYGNEVLALFGGTYDEYLKYQSSYTTYWEMIKYAASNGFERYNFYGITGDFNPDNPLIGLYTFKKDFGGQVVELLGEFDLIINSFEFRLYKIAYKCFHGLKKLKHKIKK